MAEPLLRARFRVGISRFVLRLACVFAGIGGVVGGGWFASTAGAANTQAVTYDLQGNPLTLTSTTAATAPVIVSGPVKRIARAGDTVTFSVVARGTPTLTYRWRFNGTDIPNSANATADDSTLIVSNVGAANFGTYSVAVTNSAGTAVSASVALQLDSVGDGIPDAWRVAHFGANWASNPDSAANADPDADGYTNAEEFTDGTDPNVATSHYYRLTVYGDALVVPSAPRYAPGTVVKLTAQPSGARQFAGWTITDLVANTATTSTANPLTLTLNTSYAVTLAYATEPLAQTGTQTSFTVNNHNARAEVFYVQNSDGKLLVGGTYDAIGGVAHGSLARFNTDGTLDNTFNPTFDSTVVALAQQADGKILVGGYFGYVNGVYRPYVARLNLDGTLDTAFNPPTAINSFVRGVRVRTGDTRVLVAGNFTGGVAILKTDGTLDTAFATGTGANSTVYASLWQSNGQVVLGGDFTTFNTTSNVNRLVRLKTDGSVDTSFVGSADSTVYQVAQRTDGDYVVGGFFATIDGASRRGIARLKGADGGFVAANNLGVGLVNNGIGGTGLVLQADNKAVIGGNFTGINNFAQAYVARINSDGSVDTTYTLGANAVGVDNPIYGVGLGASGNTFIGGPFNFVNGEAHLGIARLLATNGHLDSTYTVNTSYYSIVQAIAAMPDGRMVVGGQFNVVNGAYRPYVARLKADASLDTAFNAGAGPNGEVDAIALTPDGKALIGGGFTTVDGVTAGRVARFNASGSVDTGFAVAGTTDSSVTTLAVQRDGKIVAGGYFTVFNGAQRQRIARINADGTLDGSFSPAFDNRVISLAVQTDAKILVGGNFANYSGSAVGSLVRLNPDGTLDSGFALPMPNDVVESVVLQPDGKILFGGGFNVLQAPTCSPTASPASTPTAR